MDFIPFVTGSSSPTEHKASAEKSTHLENEQDGGSEALLTDVAVDQPPFLAFLELPLSEDTGVIRPSQIEGNGHFPQNAEGETQSEQIWEEGRSDDLGASDGSERRLAVPESLALDDSAFLPEDLVGDRKDSSDSMSEQNDTSQSEAGNPSVARPAKLSPSEIGGTRELNSTNQSQTDRVSIENAEPLAREVPRRNSAVGLANAEAVNRSLSDGAGNSSAGPGIEGGLSNTRIDQANPNVALQAVEANVGSKRSVFRGGETSSDQQNSDDQQPSSDQRPVGELIPASIEVDKRDKHNSTESESQEDGAEVPTASDPIRSVADGIYGAGDPETGAPQTVSTVAPDAKPVQISVIESLLASSPAAQPIVENSFDQAKELVPVSDNGQASLYDIGNRLAPVARERVLSILQQIPPAQVGFAKASQVSIRLHPVELGQLDIHVDQSDRNVVAQIVASESIAWEMLNSQKDSLIDALNQLGFEQVDVEVRQETSGDEQAGWQDERPESDDSSHGKRLDRNEQTVAAGTSKENQGFPSSERLESVNIIV